MSWTICLMIFELFISRYFDIRHLFEFAAISTPPSASAGPCTLYTMSQLEAGSFPVSNKIYCLYLCYARLSAGVILVSSVFPKRILYIYDEFSPISQRGFCISSDRRALSQSKSSRAFFIRRQLDDELCLLRARELLNLLERSLMMSLLSSLLTTLLYYSFLLIRRAIQYRQIQTDTRIEISPTLSVDVLHSTSAHVRRVCESMPCSSSALEATTPCWFMVVWISIRRRLLVSQRSYRRSLRSFLPTGHGWWGGLWAVGEGAVRGGSEALVRE